MNVLKSATFIYLLEVILCLNSVEKQDLYPPVCKITKNSVDCSNASLENTNWEFAPNTTSINLTHNKIFQITWKPYKNVHKSLKSLDLSHNKLTVIPQAIVNFTHLTVLNLSHNQINFDKRDYLRMALGNNNSLARCKNLEILDLSHNRLNVIGKELFDGIDKLTHVYIGNNNFSYMAAVYFLENDDLYTLSAPNGIIKNIFFPPGVPSAGVDVDLSMNDFSFQKNTQNFLGAWTFKIFKLGHPKLRYYPKNFEGLVSLETLILKKFCQEPLTSTIFKYMSNLKRVEVEEGTVQNVHISNVNVTDLKFSDLVNLTKIVISNTFLDTMKLVNLSQLSNLVMHNCNIVNLNKSFFEFSGLNNVKYLSLSMNPIQTLSHSNFEFFPTLEVLDLSYCNLSRVSETFALKVPSLISIDLTGNKLKKIHPRFLMSPSIQYLVTEVSNFNKILICLNKKSSECNSLLATADFQNLLQNCQTQDQTTCYICSNFSQDFEQISAFHSQNCDNNADVEILLVTLLPGLTVALVLILLITILVIHWKRSKSLKDPKDDSRNE